jgi:DNA-binding MarR family transcriptional regulator
MTKRKPRQDPLLGLPQTQFQIVARFAERQAEREIPQECGVRLIEARIICMVGSVDTCPFKVLTTSGGLDKGHASRTVTGLVGKGLMVSETDMDNQRATLLHLTTAGLRFYRKLIAIAVKRNERWLAALPADERDGLTRALSTLYRTAARFGPEEFTEMCSRPSERRKRIARRTRK